MLIRVRVPQSADTVLLLSNVDPHVSLNSEEIQEVRECLLSQISLVVRLVAPLQSKDSRTLNCS